MFKSSRNALAALVIGGAIVYGLIFGGFVYKQFDAMKAALHNATHPTIQVVQK